MTLTCCLISLVDPIRTVDGGDTNAPCERVAYTGMLKAQENISVGTPEDIGSLRQRVEFGPAPVQEIQTISDGHVVIDPAVRERIANPKSPVRMPERPFESLLFHDFTRRDNCGKRRNKSRVNGLFGREWREKIEEKEQREFADEDNESEESFLDIRDNICPTFMIWGVCHRGDRCELRHPSYRYLERPKKATSNPEPVEEEPKPRDPNSYAAILEKTRSPETEEFVNDCLPKNCLTEEILDEAWPALGSSKQGRIGKAQKAWRPKGDTPNAPQVWATKSTTQKGPCRILEEKPKATVEQLQIASDELIADSLQADEYATLEVYGENDQDYYSYYNPEQEVNEDEFFENVEETNAEDESSFHHEGKVVNEEQFNYSSSSPVILETTSRSTEDPDPPKLSSMCDICMDRPKDATLVCGHRYCYQCALQMRLDEGVCAICRRCIVSVIKTYN